MSVTKKIDNHIENTFYKMFRNKHDSVGSVLDYIPIEYITNQVVKIKNRNEYRMVLKIRPVNFFNKSQEEIDSIIAQFEIFLRNLKDPIQIVTQSKSINISDNIQLLKSMANKTTQQAKREYINKYANFLYNLSQDSNILMKGFYIVVEYSPKKEEAFLTTKKILKYMADRMSTMLKNCQLQSYVMNDDELYQLYYVSYNKDKIKMQDVDNMTDYMTIAANKKGYKDELKPVYKKQYRNINADNLMESDVDFNIMTAKDIISSDDIDINKSELVINNRYVRTIFVSGIAADTASAEWLDEIFGYPANIDVSLHLAPVDTKSVQDKLTRMLSYQIADADQKIKDNKIASKDIENNVEEIEYLRTALSHGLKFFYVSILLSISAESLEELDDITLQIESIFGGKRIITRRGTLLQLDAFNSAVPFGVDYIKNYRPMLSDTAATLFPFSSSELSSYKGKPILYGINMQTSSSLIMLDKFAPIDDTITNYNTIICGVTGSGKSYAAKIINMRSNGMQVKLMGIDPNHEYMDMTKRCGGEYISVSTSSKDRINIFDISFYRDEYGNIPNLLQDKIASLHSIFRTMFEENKKEYAVEYKNVLDKAIKDTYKKFEITDNPETLFIDNKIREGNPNLVRRYYKEVPTLSDLNETLLKYYSQIGKEVSDILYIYIDGSFNIFNGKSTINTDSDIVFFDIKEVKEDQKTLVYMILCEFISEKLKIKPRSQQAILLVDEAWIMMQREQTARFLSDYSRISRKFNVSLTLVTQRAKDFYRDKWGYGDTIYANTAMHILMRQDKDSAEIIAETYHLSPGITAQLMNLQIGHGFIFWGNYFTQIYFLADKFEEQIINTNPNK